MVLVESFPEATKNSSTPRMQVQGTIAWSIGGLKSLKRAKLFF
jgi:hypothetical protein